MLHDLSHAHREMLILVPVQGLSYEDAAERCGCTVGTVKSRIHRARVALAAMVSEEVGDEPKVAGEPGGDRGSPQRPRVA